MTKVTMTKFPKSTHNAVAAASAGLPSVQAWLKRIEAIGDPRLTEAVEGIWCGRDGRVTIDIPASKSMLMVGWHKHRVEFSYLS